MQPLRILILSDGRPGHYHLAEGVAAAIGRRRSLVIEKRGIARRGAVPGRVMAWMLARHVSPSVILRAGYGLRLAKSDDFDLVISAGGDTLAANVAAARVLGVANIFCGTLRHVSAHELALVVSSYARHASLPNHLVALKPNGIDPDTLMAGGIETPRLGALPRVAGLLIGGDLGVLPIYRCGMGAPCRVHR